MTYVDLDKSNIKKFFFWFLQENICCGYSLEARLAFEQFVYGSPETSIKSTKKKNK